MNDELHNRLMRAADDSDRSLPVQPTELLARARNDRKRYRVRVAGASGALAIGAAAAVIAATAVMPSGSDGSDRGVAPAGPSHKVEPTSDGPIPVDLGPLSEEQKQAILTVCGAWGSEYGGYQVEFARKYDRMDGPSGVVIIRMNDGRIMECTARLDTLVDGEATKGIENSDPADLPTDIPEPDAEHPLVSFMPFTADAHRGLLPNRPGSYFEASGVFLAADSVDRVEVRVGTPEGPEPWRVAEVRNGMVFWTAWAEPGTLDNDDNVWVSWRAYDKQGNLIDPDLLPYPDQRVKPVA